jgi:hypothetical protein
VKTPTICNAIQERIVAGESLDEPNQAHTLTCMSCSRFVSEWLALDSLIAEEINDKVVVPDGFADRVMARIEPAADATSRFDTLLGRRWVQLALTQVGLAVAIANLLRFVFSTLLSASSLGGVR